MSILFSGVRGQDRAVNIISKQLTCDNLSHAYLFLGKEGSGREYLSRLFSKYILCGSKKEDDCNNCKKFERNTHPDFLYINGGNGIKIEEIRKVIERLYLSPNLSKKKVLLITEVGNMSIEAANALLKTLEEPPLDTIIILTAITEKSVPQTIVSRTQLVKLKILSNNDIKKLLSKEFPKVDLEKIIDLSGGSINKTKELMNDKVVLKEREELENDVICLFESESIIEKFKIIEKYDKDKKIKELLEYYSKRLFVIINKKIHSSQDAKNEIILAKEILKVYSNLDYNVSLRISLEKILLLEHLNV